MKILELRLAGRIMRTAGLTALLLVLALGAARGSGVTPNDKWANFYSSHSTSAGLLISADAYVAAFDPRGVQCGEFTVNSTGKYGLMPCYGDDGNGGPRQGERLSFTVNGSAATPQAVSRNLTPVPSDTLVTWSLYDLWEVDLILPPRPPVTITLLTNQLRLDWSFAGADVTTYEIWRSTTPYFAPGDLDAARRMIVPSAGPLIWLDTAGLGDPAVNYTYRVRSLNALSQTVGMSQAAGEFEFALVR